MTKFIDLFWNFVNTTLSELNGNVVLSIGVLIITGFFAYFLRNFMKSTKQIKSDLDEANKLLSSNSLEAFSETEEGFSNRIPPARRQFYRNYEEIKERLSKSKSLGHSWDEFIEHIISPTQEEASQKSEEDLEMKNSIQPSLFFNEEYCIENNVDIRYIESIPGKLTGLGVLGTFIGLTIGIASATIGLKSVGQSDNTSELLKTLIQLLSGASLAFTTSIFGIGYSILFSFLEKNEIKKIKKQLKRFVESLEKALLFITNEQISMKINDNIIEQNKKFDGFSTELAIALENALKNTFESPFKAGVSEIVNGLSSIREVQQGFSDGLMTELVDKMSGGLTNEAAVSQQKANETFNTLQETFAKQTFEMVESQNAMAATSRQLLGEISETSRSNQDALNEQLKGTISSLEGSLDKINLSFKKNMGESSENMKTTLTKTFSDVSNQIIKQQEGMNTKMESSTDKLHSLIERISLMMKESGNLIEVSNENINKNNNITEKYRGLISEQQKVFSSLEACSESINKSGEQFNFAGNQIESASKDLGEISEVLKGSNENLEAIWNNYEERFENVDESLKKVFEEFIKGSDKYLESVKGHGKSIEKEYRKSINILGENLDSLSENLGDFSDSVSKARRRG